MTATSVFVCGADFGPAPVTLPPAQVAQLLGPGAVLGLLSSPAAGDDDDDHRSNGTTALSSGPVAAGITFLADGSIHLSRNGAYVVSTSGGSGESPAAAAAARAAAAEGPRRAFRQAQYLCAVIGTLLLNLMLWFDQNNRLTNAKDFCINFASDIIACGAVLIITETLMARDAAWEAATEATARQAAAGGGGGGMLDFAREFALRLWNGSATRAVRQRFSSSGEQRRANRSRQALLQQQQQQQDVHFGDDDDDHD
jgi:hypothetical protein